MTTRTLWKGVLVVGDRRVPVRMYAAIADRAVHFRLLHAKDQEPVRQRMVHPDTGDEVAADEVRRGAEIERDVFVMFSEEELESLEPEASRDIEVLRFVPSTELHHGLFDRPYLLGPDGDDEAYAALVAALGPSDLQGIARWTMRKREYVGALTVHEERLALVTLRFAGEVVTSSEIARPGSEGLDKNDVKMARQLIGMFESEFDPSSYQDEHKDRVLELIATKAKGGKVARKPAPKQKSSESLSSALKASLAASRKR